ncbi:peptidoglycan editing factor PgeF [Chamaesiphon sp. VAR_48_metabat_403]|uniref:peptidoglycan editing factor PgeF n=1 Tax=Chamaesiphon sp. VAR_48_metabat_403 TaxID=2964700 RepID=UPI00286E11B3|nr:peptidoglycan editing factor PgeF [Chamaesiphon sp. VAR_48_metabat_403]
MWQWQTELGLPYLTCDLLADWQHGFFTRQFSPREPQELTPFLAATASTHRLKQIHGKVVLTPTEITNAAEIEVETGYALGDGLLTETATQAVWVASADCNPILIANRHTGNVAAVHAGWRGTSLGIVKVAVTRLLAHGGSLDDIIVAIGPAIDGKVYQVTKQVGLEVCTSICQGQGFSAGKGFANANAPKPLSGNLDADLTSLLGMSNSPLLPDEQAGRVRLDVRRVNQLQLEGLGVNLEQISIAPHCTFQEPEYFFSYRREKLKKIQWSGIVSK